MTINVLKFIPNRVIIGENMTTLNIHGRQIPWDDSEIGIYKDWNETNPVGYSAMDLGHFQRVANEMSVSDCVEAANSLYGRAKKQAEFEYPFELPERFMTGILNTQKLMKKIIDEFSDG